MTFQEKFETQVTGIFEKVKNSKQSYYSQYPEKRPSAYEADRIINDSAKMNFAISGSMSLIPGPLGLVSVVPELALITNNQIAMIYDIGLAYGKEKHLTKELLLGVTISAMGSSAGGLLVMHGSKVVVKKASVKVFQNVVKVLAGKITQKVAKSALGKFVPLLGAAALATWSAYTTKMIGKRAIEIFSKEIEFDNSEVQDVAFEEVAMLEPANSKNEILEYEKIKVLINLANADRVLHFSEKDHLETLITNCSLSDEIKLTLANQLETNDRIEIDYSVLKGSPEDSVSLLMDMITLAQKDGKMHAAEKLYIKMVADKLNLEKEIVEELLAENFELAAI